MASPHLNTSTMRRSKKLVEGALRAWIQVTAQPKLPVCNRWSDESALSTSHLFQRVRARTKSDTPPIAPDRRGQHATRRRGLVHMDIEGVGESTSFVSVQAASQIVIPHSSGSDPSYSSPCVSWSLTLSHSDFFARDAVSFGDRAAPRRAGDEERRSEGGRPLECS